MLLICLGENCNRWIIKFIGHMYMLCFVYWNSYRWFAGISVPDVHAVIFESWSSATTLCHSSCGTSTCSGNLMTGNYCVISKIYKTYVWLRLQHFKTVLLITLSSDFKCRSGNLVTSVQPAAYTFLLLTKSFKSVNLVDIFGCGLPGSTGRGWIWVELSWILRKLAPALPNLLRLTLMLQTCNFNILTQTCIFS